MTDNDLKARLNAAWNQADAYAADVSKALGLPAKAVDRYEETSREGFSICINVGGLVDDRRADLIKHRLAPIFEATFGKGHEASVRLEQTESFLKEANAVRRPPLSFDIHDIVEYDTTNGKGAFVNKMKSLAPQIKRALEAAEAETKAYEALPNIPPLLPGNLPLEDNFNDLELGIDNERYQQNPLKIRKADFVLPASVKAGAIDFAREVRSMLEEKRIDPVKTKELGWAAALDGNGGTLTDQEIASALLAKSMPLPMFGCGKTGLITHFDNRLYPKSFRDEMMTAGGFKQSRDPIVQQEMARQILGDSYDIQAPNLPRTNTPEGDKAFDDAVGRSGKTPRERC